jgi:hypothetical protein
VSGLLPVSSKEDPIFPFRGNDRAQRLSKGAKGQLSIFNLKYSIIMSTSDYTTTISVDKTPKEAFNAINNVRGWWTDSLEGKTQKLNDEFTVQFGKVHVSTQKLVEVIPDKKVVWLVTKSNLNFIKDKQEWNNTTISFEISQKNDKTQVKFTHHGLLPDIECFDACSNAWRGYIKGSLKSLINTGKGEPTPK